MNSHFGSKAALLSARLTVPLLTLAATLPFTASVAWAQSNGAGARFAIIQLNAPNGVSRVYGISNVGDVVGLDDIANTDFLWHEGQAAVLYGIVANVSAEAWDVNSAHTVVGNSRGTLYNNVEATLWYAGQDPIGLGTLGGDMSQALAINELGHVTGNAWTENDENTHAYLWHDDVMDDLGSLADGFPSFGYDVNNLDQVVGYSFLAIADAHAVLLDHGNVVDLGILPGGGQSYAYAINDHMQIVGEARNSAGNYVAFVWQDGAMHSINDPRYGRWSAAYDINNHAQVVGTFNGNGVSHSDAFIWDPVHGMHNLEEFLPPDSRWDLTFAHAINDHGQIVGSGSRYTDINHDHTPLIGFMMTPVHSTIHMDNPSPGQAGTDNTLTVHGVDPGKTVFFFYGQIGGGHLIPGCNSQTGAVLQMDDPTVIGSTTADSNGNAQITVFVPREAHNAGDFLIQAVQPSGCRISQLVVQRFE